MLTDIAAIVVTVHIAVAIGFAFVIAAISLIDEQTPAATLRQEWADLSSWWSRLRRPRRYRRPRGRHVRTAVAL